MPVERPRQRCQWHPAGETTPSHVAWPLEYQAWAHDRGLLSTGAAAAGPPSDRPSRADGQLRIINPPTGATYLIDPTLRAEFQTLGLRAASTAGGPIEWHVDARAVGTGAANERVEWPLVPGAHTITARDQQGHRSVVSIVVK